VSSIAIATSPGWDSNSERDLDRLADKVDTVSKVFGDGRSPHNKCVGRITAAYEEHKVRSGPTQLPPPQANKLVAHHLAYYD